MSKFLRWRNLLVAFVVAIGLCNSDERRTFADPPSLPPDTIVPTERNGNANQTDDFAPEVDVRVTPDGALAAHVGLWVPPGRAGMQPELALDYNSRSPLSALGYGWHLSGIPVITRCRRSAADPPNGTAGAGGVPTAIHFDGYDQLCVDGEPLVPEVDGTSSSYAGTAYRTLVDRHARYVVTSAGADGPNEITAYRKDGRIFTFGAVIRLTQARSGGSTVEAGSYVITCPNLEGTPTPQKFGWGLSRVSDRSGNEMTIDWKVINDDQSCPPRFASEYYPTTIQYASNSHTGLQPTKKIELVYLDQQQDFNFRSDVPRWISGVQIAHNKRLSEIDEYGPDPQAPGTQYLMKQYLLSYSQGSNSFVSQHQELLRTMLSTIKECDGATTCKPPIVLQYDDSGYDYFNTAGTQQVETPINDLEIRHRLNARDPSYWPRLYSGDFNHDGKDDLVYLSTTPSRLCGQQECADVPPPPTGCAHRDWMVQFASGTVGQPTIGPGGADTGFTPYECPGDVSNDYYACYGTRLSVFDAAGTGYRDSLAMEYDYETNGGMVELIAYGGSIPDPTACDPYNSVDPNAPRVPAFLSLSSQGLGYIPHVNSVMVADLNGDGISEILGTQGSINAGGEWQLWRRRRGGRISLPSALRW